MYISKQYFCVRATRRDENIYRCVNDVRIHFRSSTVLMVKSVYLSVVASCFRESVSNRYACKIRYYPAWNINKSAEFYLGAYYILMFQKWPWITRLLASSVVLSLFTNGFMHSVDLVRPFRSEHVSGERGSTSFHNSRTYRDFPMANAVIEKFRYVTESREMFVTVTRRRYPRGFPNDRRRNLDGYVGTN